jgi:hypothetical protein
MTGKRGGGRKKCSARLYAEELGISFRRLRVLGGEARLRAMSSDALAVMLRPGPIGGSQTYRVRGLAGRGYKKFVPGVVSQAERVA